MKLVHFKDSNESDVFVNPEMVTHICPSTPESLTIVYLQDINQPIAVNGTLQEVSSKLTAPANQPITK